MAEIKKVIQRIYEFDLSNCQLIDGDEMISTDHGNEFVNTFRKVDMDKGIIVTPQGYSKGLVFKTSNDGEFFNNPEWLPEIVSFSLNCFGLKKNTFYRITVEGRDTRKYNGLLDITDNRQLEVSNSAQELLINENLADVLKNEQYSGIFRATRNEENIFFNIGKIYISNIIIDEVEIAKDEEVVVEAPAAIEFDSGKSNIVAFGVFSSNMINKKGRYFESERITGKGISLFYDTTEHVYILERDNYEDSIGTAFTASNFIVDINMNKAPYAQYVVTDVSVDASPNTLKQGYIKFKVTDNGPSGEKDKITDANMYTRPNGRFTFVITKVN